MLKVYCRGLFVEIFVDEFQDPIAQIKRLRLQLVSRTRRSGKGRSELKASALPGLKLIFLPTLIQQHGTYLAGFEARL